MKRKIPVIGVRERINIPLDTVQTKGAEAAVAEAKEQLRDKLEKAMKKRGLITVSDIIYREEPNYAPFVCSFLHPQKVYALSTCKIKHPTYISRAEKTYLVTAEAFTIPDRDAQHQAKIRVDFAVKHSPVYTVEELTP